MEAPRILCGRAGRLLPRLYADIGERYGRGRHVILLVPEQYTLQAERELIRRLSLPGFLNLEVLSPKRLRRKIRETGGRNNFVRMEPGVTWTEKGVSVTALPARHSDPCAIGFALEAEGRRILITGDTLLDLGWKIPERFLRPDFLFLPINGRGNNMNAADAASLAEAVGAKHAVPVHYGLLDDCTPDAFVCEAKAVLEDGKEYEI